MKTNIRGGIFHLTSCVFILFFILLQSCASTSTTGINLEGSDFRKNLSGTWEGEWLGSGGLSGEQRIKISKIDGNKVHLTGYAEGGPNYSDTDEVSGRIENSNLLLTWPVTGCEDKYAMKRDDSNNLILVGYSKCQNFIGKVQLEKIE